MITSQKICLEKFYFMKNCFRFCDSFVTLSVKKYWSNVQMCYQFYVTFFVFRQLFYVSWIFYNFTSSRNQHLLQFRFFSSLFFQVLCEQNRQTVLHQQEMKVRFWTGKLDLELLLTETKLRFRDRLRNFSIFWPIIL